jgi:hypothetical protein
MARVGPQRQRKQNKKKHAGESMYVIFFTDLRTITPYFSIQHYPFGARIIIFFKF